MNTPNTLKPWHLLLSLSLLLVFSKADPSWIPGLDPTVFRTMTIGACVIYLLLGGSYVLLKSRGDDIDYYKAKEPDTGEMRARLEKRYKNLGVLAWSMMVGGIVAFVVVVGKVVVNWPR
jgi:hypothetical protein